MNFEPGDVVLEHDGKHVLYSEIPSGALLIIVGVVMADGKIKKHRVETDQRKPE